MRDAERRDQQREGDEEPRPADHSAVDGTLHRPPPHSATAVWGHGGCDSGGYSRPLRVPAVMPDAATILLVDDEDSIQKLLTYPL
jgi:hypothetical protein